MLTSDKINFNDGTAYTNLLDIIYPIGSVYISFEATSPSELFGGTWVEIPSGYYLRSGQDINLSENFGVKLTSSHIPSHVHSLNNHTHSVTVTGGNHRHKAYTDNHAFATIDLDHLARWRVATSTTNNAWSPGTGVSQTTNIAFSSNTAYCGSLTINGTAAKSTTANTGSWGTSEVDSVPIEPSYQNCYCWHRTA